MRLSPEIKEFTKNTLILTLFFTLILHLSWGYIRPYISLWASAGNSANFTIQNSDYLWSMATAVSLNVGQGGNIAKHTGSDLSSETISIGEVLASPKDGTEKLIGANMVWLQSYLNLIRTDIVSLLDNSNDRATTLDEHIETLKWAYTKTSEHLLLIDEQTRDLSSHIESAGNLMSIAKQKMEEKYQNSDYTNIDSIIEDYAKAKEDESRARAYMVYLERFRAGYITLQTQNKKLLDTLINNREALIKRSVVVIPSTGSDLLKKLNLIQTEKDYKDSQKQ